MTTAVALVEKIRKERPLQVFTQVVLAGYELSRGDEKRAKHHAAAAQELAFLDFGDGHKSLDQVVQEFLEKL